MMNPTVADILRLYIADRMPVVASPKTLRCVVKPVQRLIGDLPAAAVDQEVIDRYIVARRAEGVRDGTVRRDLSVLLAARRLAHRKHLIPAPTHVIIPQKGMTRQRVLSPEEVRQLIDATTDPRTRLFILIGLSTGARLTAIAELTWDRIDLDAGLINFRAPHPRAQRRKGRAITPISETLAGELRRRRPESGSGMVFDVAACSLRLGFYRARDQAGLGRDVTPHVMRHTAATTMVRSVPLIMASKMLGQQIPFDGLLPGFKPWVQPILDEHLPEDIDATAPARVIHSEQRTGNAKRAADLLDLHGPLLDGLRILAGRATRIQVHSFLKDHRPVSVFGPFPFGHRRLQSIIRFWTQLRGVFQHLPYDHTLLEKPGRCTLRLDCQRDSLGRLPDHRHAGDRVIRYGAA
ncbi:MAG: site-specific integrase [Paracoccaceae bacterium]